MSTILPRDPRPATRRLLDITRARREGIELPRGGGGGGRPTIVRLPLTPSPSCAPIHPLITLYLSHHALVGLSSSPCFIHTCLHPPIYSRFASLTSMNRFFFYEKCDFSHMKQRHLIRIPTHVAKFSVTPHRVYDSTFFGIITAYHSPPTAQAKHGSRAVRPAVRSMVCAGAIERRERAAGSSGSDEGRLERRRRRCGVRVAARPPRTSHERREDGDGIEARYRLPRAADGVVGVHRGELSQQGRRVRELL